MAKKRRKVYRKTKTGWKELSPYLKRKAERERQERAKPVREADPIRIRAHTLRPLIREACRAGLVEAIEHTSNFWNVSDGFRRYIQHQIAAQAEELMVAVKTALREELTSSFVRAVRRKKSTK